MSRIMRKRGPNLWIACLCGCGKKLRQLDSKGRTREFIQGHHRRGKQISEAHRRALSRAMTGDLNHRWNPDRLSVGRVGQDFTKAQRRRLLGESCRRCGSSDRLELDHILPIMAGGTNADQNAQTLCWRCNSRKRQSDIRHFSGIIPAPKKAPHKNWLGNRKARPDGLVRWDKSSDGFRMFRRKGTRLLLVQIKCRRCGKKHLMEAWKMRAYNSRPRPKNHFCSDACRLKYLNGRRLSDRGPSNLRLDRTAALRRIL